MKIGLFSVWCGMVLAGFAGAAAQQVQPPPTAVNSATAAPPVEQLKPEVKVELLTDQKEMYQTMLRMKTLEAQYQEFQRQFNAKQIEFNQKLFTALERSGLDKKKFTVNPENLTVTALPAKPNKPGINAEHLLPKSEEKKEEK